MSYVTPKIDERVVGLLKAGGVGLMPSDTVYGLSCLALDKGAVLRLHNLKDRSQYKPFIILISNIEMLDQLSIFDIPNDLVANYWPGLLTIILEAPSSPNWLNQGLSTLAIRLPADKNLLSLIDRLGPLISTSANIEGKPTVTTAQEAQATFGSKLDFYVDKGIINNAYPSTIVKIVDNQLEIVRQGALTI